MSTIYLTSRAFLKNRIAHAVLTTSMVAVGHFLAGIGFFYVLQKLPSHPPTALEMVGITVFVPPCFSNSLWLGRIPYSLVFSLVCYFVIGGIWRRLWHERFVLRFVISSFFGILLSFMIILFIGFIFSVAQLWPHKVARTSYSFQTTQQKIRFLTKHITAHSPIIDTEYAMYISAGGPWPSNYDIHVAVKVAPQDVDLWIDSDWKPATQYETEHFDPSIRCVGLAAKPRKEDEDIQRGFYRAPNLDTTAWQHTSEAEYYKFGSHTFLIVYRKEGIIIYTSYSD